MRTPRDGPAFRRRRDGSSAQGRTIIGTNPVAGNGLSARDLGDTAGEEQHTMTISELVPHTHNETIASANGFAGADGEPSGGGYLGAAHSNGFATASTGGGAPFNNLQPSLALLYCQKN
jgi:microcystin-dependent protein